MSRAEYSPRMVGHIADSLVWKIGSENVAAGRSADDHLTEGYVQDKIALLLRPQLPDTSLLSCNDQLAVLAPDRKLIPDILIHRIGGGPWGAFEIKTLFVDDQLNAAAVEQDLDKLCAYKEAYPSLAAVFVLVGSRQKLFNTHRQTAWADLRIRYDHQPFVSSPPQVQGLFDKRFAAVPCGGWTSSDLDLCLFMWEVVTVTDQTLVSPSYRFTAEMT